MATTKTKAKAKPKAKPTTKTTTAVKKDTDDGGDDDHGDDGDTAASMAAVDVDVQDLNKLSPVRVILMGTTLLFVGMTGFYTIDGLVVPDAKGSRLVNAFYCAVMTLTTVGFGDICPGETDFAGTVFLTALPLLGLGFFCGPILTLTSSWQNQISGGGGGGRGGGVMFLAIVTLTMGVSTLTILEGMSLTEAIHLSVITGTTIGFGNSTPSSDMGRIAWALYAILVINVMGGLLDVSRTFLESICREGSVVPAPVPAPTAPNKKED